MADAPDLGSGVPDVQVQVLLSASNGAKQNTRSSRFAPFCVAPKRYEITVYSRGGKAAKIHAIVDCLGNPVHFMLSGGQVHDSKAAVKLL